MRIVCFAVAFAACLIGNICGMGGGVIIKPVLNSLGMLSMTAINFLSSCTVLGMSFWSVSKSFIRHETQIDLRLTTMLAVGAAAGGVIGKKAFTGIVSLLSDATAVSVIQAAMLMILTFATFLYIRNEEKIRTRRVDNLMLCGLIGLGLGMLGAFLGIGGGPFNVMALCYFFSMDAKTAAKNSLYIIFVSQLTGLLQTILSNNMPAVDLILLFGMIICGILGSETGIIINDKISNNGVRRLFELAMLMVIAICVYNLCRLLVI